MWLIRLVKNMGFFCKIFSFLKSCIFFTILGFHDSVYMFIIWVCFFGRSPIKTGSPNKPSSPSKVPSPQAASPTGKVGSATKTLQQKILQQVQYSKTDKLADKLRQERMAEVNTLHNRYQNGILKDGRVLETEVFMKQGYFVVFLFLSGHFAIKASPIDCTEREL